MSEISTEEKKPVGRPRKYVDSFAKDYVNQTFYNQNYYKKKETLKKQIIDCECGNKICLSNLNIHLKTKLHKRRLALKKNLLN